MTLLALLVVQAGSIGSRGPQADDRHAVRTPLITATVLRCRSGAFMKFWGPLTILAVGLFGCADQKAERRSRGEPRDASTSSVPDVAPRDAKLPSLGSYESIRSRFERECPFTLPTRVGDGAAPLLELSEVDRGCTVPVSAKARDGVVVRSLDVGFDHADDRNRSYHSVVSGVESVSIIYGWKMDRARSISRMLDDKPDELLAAISQCQTLPEEGAAYLQEMAGLSDSTAARFVALLRSRTEDVEYRVSIEDLTVYFLIGFEIPENGGCAFEVEAGATLQRGIKVVDVALPALP